MSLYLETVAPERWVGEGSVAGVHVVQVRDLTQRLTAAGRAHGPDSEVSSAAAASAIQLLKISGAGPIKQALMAAVPGCTSTRMGKVGRRAVPPGE